MNIDDPDLIPVGASLSRPVFGPHGRPVATFTAPPTLHPDALWTPLSRTNDITRGGLQGAPFGQPGHGLEHEPLNQAERDSEHTVQRAALPHVEAAAQIRAALRPGV